jgi:hypothetical protein
MTMVCSQAAPFTGPGYDYLRADDALPCYTQIAGERDPLCRVRLFQPFSRWTYYVCAATRYDGIDGPVLTGFCISALGRECDEFGDQGLAEIAALRLHGLPPERDLHFQPLPLSAVEAHVAPPRLRALNQERPARLRATGAPARRRKEDTCNWPRSGRATSCASTRRAVSSRLSCSPSAIASWT